MTDLDLITNRRREVLKILEAAQKALTEAQSELSELDVAGKTIARLSGGEWPPAGEEGPTITQISGKARTIHWTARANGRALTVTDMLMTVLQDAHDSGVQGMAPKDVRSAIKAKFNSEVRSEYMSTTMWRLAERGKLDRVGEGLYALPGGAALANLDEETRKLV